MDIQNINENNFWKFPAGEIGVRLGIPDRRFYKLLLHARIQNSDDIMKLLMVTDAYRRQGAKDIELYLPYFPYARQDRVCNKGESHSLKVMADLINTQKYSTVHVLDPHSDVLSAVLENAKFYTNSNFFSKALELSNLSGASIVSPDAGAEKKIYKLVQSLPTPFEIYTASKVRNSLTGEVECVSISGIQGYTGTLLVVDDICDGGATFINLAKAIKEMAPHCELRLVVTHGIFSRGLSPLLEYYSHIYTTNSFKDHDSHDKLTVIDYKEAMQ